MDLVEKARIFAIAAHEAAGQVRKYNNEPYWHHPRRVVALLSASFDRQCSDIVAAAGWLHDVVEDTDVRIDVIYHMFGSKVATIVDELTNKATHAMGNRRFRFEFDMERSARMSAAARSVRCADIIDNLDTFEAMDPKFAPTYFAEKRELLQVLKGGDVDLWEKANTIVEEYFARQDARPITGDFK